MRWASTWCVLLLCCIVVPIASAQEFQPGPRPYDGIQAGLDAFRLAEEQRQSALSYQLNLNEQMRAWSGLPSSRGTAIWYGYPVAGHVADLDYAYAYAAPGPRSGFGRLGIAPLTVFEPLAFVPGDIYGYTYVPPVRQPIGQWQGQTGPNRWESHPIYAVPPPALRPLPEVESPLLDNTPYATDRPRFRER